MTPIALIRTDPWKCAHCGLSLPIHKWSCDRCGSIDWPFIRKYAVIVVLISSACLAMVAYATVTSGTMALGAALFGILTGVLAGVNLILLATKLAVTVAWPKGLPVMAKTKEAAGLAATESPITLAAELCRLRRRVGLGLAELALKAQMSETYLADLEADRAVPSPLALRKLADVLEPVGANYHGLVGLIPTEYRVGDYELGAAKNPGERNALLARRDSARAELVRRDVLSWGLSTITVGLVHFALEALMYEWGYVLVAVGIALIVVRRPVMFVVTAFVIFLAGLWNILVAMSGGPAWLGVLGLMQFGWAGGVYRKWLDAPPKYSSKLAS